MCGGPPGTFIALQIVFAHFVWDLDGLAAAVRKAGRISNDHVEYNRDR